MISVCSFLLNRSLQENGDLRIESKIEEVSVSSAVHFCFSSVCPRQVLWLCRDLYCGSSMWTCDFETVSINYSLISEEPLCLLGLWTRLCQHLSIYKGANFFFSLFFGLHSQQMEVSQPGIDSEPQLWQSWIFTHCAELGIGPSLPQRQCRTLNPLCHSRNSRKGAMY